MQLRHQLHSGRSHGVGQGALFLEVVRPLLNRGDAGTGGDHGQAAPVAVA